MNKIELMKQIRPNTTYDLALPMQWVDSLHDNYKIPYRCIISNFVWLYDEKSSIFGRPFPLTMAGWVVCKIANINWC